MAQTMKQVCDTLKEYYESEEFHAGVVKSQAERAKRVSDQVAWAKEILKRYEPSALALEVGPWDMK